VIRLPDGKPGKVLAAAICAVTVLAAYTVVIGPLTSLYDRGEQTREERLEALRRLEAAAAELPRLRAAAKQWDEKTNHGDPLLEGASDPVAGALLQSTLKEMIEDGGATLSTAELLPAETADKFRRIGLRVSFSGDLNLITAVLSGIESARPVIFVDNLDIRTSRESDGDSAGESYTIALDVHGFRAL